jgi:DeoR family fructose operon transcriptional repressor
MCYIALKITHYHTGTPMFPADRRRRIAQYVREQGSISIGTLSEMFSVSDMTIHRDLAALEEMGLLRKTRGGAVPSEQYLVPVDYRARLQSYPEEKDAIGKRAVEFIRDGDTIILDPGTTCLSIARNLRGFHHLNVITSGPLIILELAQIPGIDVHSTGGILSKQTMAYVGPQAEEVLSSVRAAKCFIGANGFTVQDGVTDPLHLESSVKRKMVEVSNEVYLVVTPDKFGRVAPYISVPLGAIDVIIMHNSTPEKYTRQLASKDIRCEIA